MCIWRICVILYQVSLIKCVKFTSTMWFHPYPMRIYPLLRLARRYWKYALLLPFPELGNLSTRAIEALVGFAWEFIKTRSKILRSYLSIFVAKELYWVLFLDSKLWLIFVERISPPLDQRLKAPLAYFCIKILFK